MKFKTITIVTSLILSSSAIAGSTSWDYIEGGYATLSIEDSGELSPSGVSIAASKLAGEHVFITAGYSLLSDDVQGVDIEFTQAYGGIGYRFILSDTKDIYTKATYEYVELVGSLDSQGELAKLDDTGYGLAVGFRARMSESFEFDGSVGSININDESEMVITATGFYDITDSTALGLAFRHIEDSSMYNVSLRFNF